MRFLQSFSLVTFLIYLVGCATGPEKGEGMSDPRGIGISGLPESEIRKSLSRYVSEREYELIDSDRRTLSFDKPAGRWASMRYGSFVSPETFQRMKVMIMDVGAQDFWIGFEPLIVTERGSGFEKAVPLKGQASHEMQSLLEGWKAELMGQ